ncbi:MAG: efflux RND transporter periplasmic adaptor subunit, partial [Terriglobia bacterium]
SVPVEINVIGSGEAYLTVNVKSLVQGEVQRVYFKDGQFVRQGDTLFSIDPAPFQAALAQAKANLAHDQAQADYAKSQDTRYTALYQSGIVSQDQYDQFRNNYAALAAAVEADQAAIDNAKLNLGYCTIRSPIDGKTGAVQIVAGNLVKVNDVPMVVINQINPIYVNFSVPQQYLPQIKQYEARRPLRVEAILPHQPDKPEWGTLTFINNTVDVNTGTILLKGTFPNAQRRLWPGEFVNVVLNLSVQSNAVVAPSTAIQTGQQGHYVYVVGGDHKAQLRPVTAGSVYKDKTVIEKGLKPGETVVTDGQLLLYPGATVMVKSSL